jgi:glyoxylase-like metal-dependent hydrolase (beta-lactamase superfamily II)/8-oxo-dGTP pyrophosphatase MutT (NUDIX family)
MAHTNAGERAADTPRPAATLVILRDSLHGPQVLLTVRPKTMRFMGGAVVFPGGAVASADLDERWEQLTGLSRHDAAAKIDVEDGRTALGAYVAALREAFEEVGFILGGGPLYELSRDFADEPRRFLERCLELGVTLGADQLVPAGRWVTPLGSPVRFDARFFVVRAPKDWEPEPDPTEVDDAYWATPARALAGLAAGDVVMAPPTIEMLQRLDGSQEVASIMTSLRNVEWQKKGEILRVRLSPQVSVVLAPNAGLLTGPGTNTYVVGRGAGSAGPQALDRTLVIDPAVNDEPFLDAVVELAGDVESILVTHRHPDHTGGVAALAHRTGARVRAFGTEPVDGVEVVPLADGDELSAGGVTLRALHTPGHASDHLCFEMMGTKSLFAGDNILGEGTAVIAPPDGHMRDYLFSLYRLRGLEPERIYPGHFRPLDGGTAVIEGYLQHRAERRQAVLSALSVPSSEEDIVERVYTDTPARLHPIALYQVRAVLESLKEEELVDEIDELWKLSDVH